jgi:diacylglycerol kinase (ATP)
MRVVCDGRATCGPLFLACAGNSEFAGGGVMRLSPGAKMDDGLMHVSLIDSVGRREIAGQFLRLLKGTHVSHPKVRYTTATSLQVETEPSSLITVDGDLVGHTPACFEVKPGALKILTVRRSTK